MIEDLEELLKQFKAKIKTEKPKVLKPLTSPSVKKIPGLASASKKDPVKVAEQIQDGEKIKDKQKMAVTAAKQQKAALAISKNGQWKLNKSSDKTLPDIEDKTKPANYGQPSPVKSLKISNEEHGTPLNVKEEQKRLINGIDLGSGKKNINKSYRNDGVTSDFLWTKSDSHPHNVLTKHVDEGSLPAYDRHLNQLSAGERETLFHNFAHDVFGLGQYVPTTANFKHNGKSYSAQQEVAGGKHVPHAADLNNNKKGEYELPKDYKDTLYDIHEKGDLHKLALMDSILGNHDRHTGNFMYTPDKKLQLIDNGFAFGYGGQDHRKEPMYMDHALHDKYDMGLKNIPENKTIPSHVKEWLNNITPEKVQEAWKKNGYDVNNSDYRPFVETMNNRIQKAKDELKANPSVNYKDLLDKIYGVQHNEFLPKYKSVA